MTEDGPAASRLRVAVDRVWCAKCRMCAIASGGAVRFARDGYPAELPVDGAARERVREGGRKCPISALSLREEG